MMKIKNKCSAVVLKIEGMKGYENRDAPPQFISKLCLIKRLNILNFYTFLFDFERFKFIPIHSKIILLGNMNLIEF